MSKTARRESLRSLADLRPGQSIDCMRCEKSQPAEGARRFHALWVCASCSTKLQALQQKAERPGN